MARLKEKVIVLARISEDSRAQLKAMTTELLGAKSVSDPELLHWSKRFAASGKIAQAAGIRNS